MDYTINPQHISTIKAGDTVVHNNVLRTVCKNDIRRSEFFGTSLFGDSYNMGRRDVLVAIIKRALPKK